MTLPKTSATFLPTHSDVTTISNIDIRNISISPVNPTRVESCPLSPVPSGVCTSLFYNFNYNLSQMSALTEILNQLRDFIKSVGAINNRFYLSLFHKFGYLF